MRTATSPRSEVSPSRLSGWEEPLGGSSDAHAVGDHARDPAQLALTQMTRALDTLLDVARETREKSGVHPVKEGAGGPVDELRSPERARAHLERHGARLGVPPRGGFSGRFSYEQSGRPRLSWAMSRLRTEGAERAFESNLDAAARVFPDRALLAAVTLRERPSAWTARGTEGVHSYSEGGLDHLGSDLARLQGIVPRSTLARWTDLGPGVGVEPNGSRHPIHAARIPARDQLTAYAATLRLREATFESHVREVFGARADALLASMSTDARRAWVQATFGRPGKTAYDAEFGRMNPPSAYAALLRIASEAERRGAAPRLDDIFTDPLLARHASFQRARTTALEARVIEETGLVRSGEAR